MLTHTQMVDELTETPEVACMLLNGATDPDSPHREACSYSARAALEALVRTGHITEGDLREALRVRREGLTIEADLGFHLAGWCALLGREGSTTAVAA